MERYAESTGRLIVLCLHSGQSGHRNPRNHRCYPCIDWNRTKRRKVNNKDERKPRNKTKFLLAGEQKK